MTQLPLCLQALFLPELDGVDAPLLYFRGPFHVDNAGPAPILSTDGELHSNTYFNAYPLDKWRSKTTVRSIRFSMTIKSGTGVLLLSHQTPEAMRVLRRIELDGAAARVYDVDLSIDDLQTGLLFWSVSATSKLTISDARYSTASAPRQIVRVGVVITAYKRDAAVKDAMDRFERSGLRAAGHRLFIIDNGGTLEGDEVFSNANLGGAGGFTRGLLEMRNHPALTHALFMDDDAPVHMECIEKAIAFLRFANNDNMAIAGAMLAAESPALQYGAGLQLKISTPTFLKSNRDMTDVGNLLINETEEPIEVGAWFFFMFPLKSVDVLPFPYFVRGDDVLFSLQNGFDIVTLTGVACWQSSFEEKITPSTTYLAYRARFLNGCLKLSGNEHDISCVFDEILAGIHANLQSYRYAYAHAIIDAVEDVLAGPDFFERNPSAVARLSSIAAKYSAAYPSIIDADERARYVPAEAAAKHSPRYSRWLQALTRHGHRPVAQGKPPILIEGLAPCSDMRTHGRDEVLFWSQHSGLGIPTTRSMDQYRTAMDRTKRLRRQMALSGGSRIAEYNARLPYLQSEQFWRSVLLLDSDSDASGQPNAAPVGAR